MTSYKRSLDLQLVLFSLHFSPYPLRARELWVITPPVGKEEAKDHMGTDLVYTGHLGKHLYRRKASISNPFSNFHIFDFSILSSSYRLEFETR